MNNADSSRQIRIGTVLSYASMIVGYAAQILYTPFMIRMVGQTQYGIYNLTNSVVSYLSLFSLGFGSAYVRFYMRHKAERGEKAKEGIAKLNGMFLAVFILLGIFAVIAGMILVGNTKFILGEHFSTTELVLAKNLMMLLVINLAISFPLIPFVSYIQSNERFIFQNGLNIIRQVLGPLIGIPLLLSGLGAYAVALATTLVSVLIAVCQLIYSFQILSFKFTIKGVDFRELREVAIFSSFIFLNSITDQINWNIDKFILGRFYGAISVAIYGIATQLNSYYVSFSTAISSVYIPKINSIVSEGRKDMNSVLTSLFIKIGRIQFMVVGLVLVELIFVGRPFIGIWAGKDYYPAYPILLVLIVPVTVPLVQNAGIAIQQAKNMHIFRSITYLAIAVGNAVLSYFLAKPFGGMGTAIATALSLIIGNVIAMNWYYQEKIGLNIQLFWKSIFRFIWTWLVTIVVGLISVHLIDSYTIVGFLGTAVVIAVSYTLMLYFTVFDQDEKKFVRTKINID